MFNDHRHIYFGFHGCEKSLAKENLLNRSDMTPSVNLYDWLGSGVYFWENDPIRAFEFAKDVKKCKEPFVIGAVLNLGYCLDLTCRSNTDRLASIWENIARQSYEEGGIKSNKPGRLGENGELLLRYLDRYIIETLHKYNKDMGYEEYDSVRAAFWEGNELYPTAGFREKNHIQICIRNLDCILGTFLPHGYLL